MLLFRIKVFCFFFIKSASIHKIVLCANRKKPFLWKVIFIHETFWSRVRILAGQALLFDVSWLRFLKPELFLWFRCIRSKWCYCDQVNNPRINPLQHSSFSKPMLFCITLFWTNFWPEHLNSCIAESCLSLLRYLEFFNKQNIFLGKAILSYDKFY